MILQKTISMQSSAKLCADVSVKKTEVIVQKLKSISPKVDPKNLWI